MLIFAFLLIAFAFANNNAGGLDAPQLKRLAVTGIAKNKVTEEKVSFSGTIDIDTITYTGTSTVTNSFIVTGSIKGKAGKTPISSALLNTPLKFISGRTTKRDLAQFTTNAICPILSLDIGPIDLDLLGLIITIDPIVIDIVAESGPGNLLGNLLCAIAGLLDPTPIVSPIQNFLLNLLQALLGALGNLL